MSLRFGERWRRLRDGRIARVVFAGEVYVDLVFEDNDEQLLVRRDSLRSQYESLGVEP